jgi:hypothetical protein
VLGCMLLLLTATSPSALLISPPYSLPSLLSYSYNQLSLLYSPYPIYSLLAYRLDMLPPSRSRPRPSRKSSSTTPPTDPDMDRTVYIPLCFCLISFAVMVYVN